MTFVSPDLAQGVLLTSPTVSDGSLNTEGNLNDVNTGTTAANEIRAGMAGYKITHDLGFPVANLDNSNFKVRIFDGSMMSVTDVCMLLPYVTSSTVLATNEVFLQVVDDGAYDEITLSAAMVDDFVDIGTNEISIRLAVYNSSGRGRFNEIQIEFFELASDPVFDQDGFQFIEDDGSEITATDVAAEDTNITRDADENTRLRVQIDTTGGDPPSAIRTLQYKEVGDAASEWRDVPLT